MTKYLYTGVFFEYDDLTYLAESVGDTHLSDRVISPHVTLLYRPEEVDESLFGRIVPVRVLGYGRDSENEGFRVEYAGDDPAIAELFDAVPVPHITLALGEGGKAVNTRDLEFTPIEPVILAGIYGGMDEDGDLILHGSHRLQYMS